jgi:hypothetical protein
MVSEEPACSLTIGTLIMNPSSYKKFETEVAVKKQKALCLVLVA